MFVSFLRNSFLHDQSDRNLEVAFEVASIKPFDRSSLFASRTGRSDITHPSKFTTQECRNPVGVENISCPELNLTLNSPRLDDSPSGTHLGQENMNPNGFAVCRFPESHVVFIHQS